MSQTYGFFLTSIRSVVFPISQCMLLPKSAVYSRTHTYMYIFVYYGTSDETTNELLSYYASFVFEVPVP